jgi:preprotein translocase subunit SecD
MKQFRHTLVMVLLISLLATLLSACGAKKAVHIVLEADMPNDISIRPEDMVVARHIIQERCAAWGIRNARVLVSGSRQMTVDFSVPEATDPGALASDIARTGLLEFVEMGSQPPAEGTIIQTDFMRAGAGPNGIVPLTPASQASPAPDSTGAPAVPTIYHTIMSGSSLETVTVETSRQAGSTGFVIAITLYPDAAQVFAEYTGSHIGQVLAIVMDKKIISSPTINAKIEKGSAYIEGSFTLDSANALATLMRYGALPLPLKVIESNVISPAQ